MYDSFDDFDECLTSHSLEANKMLHRAASMQTYVNRLRHSPVPNNREVPLLLPPSLDLNGCIRDDCLANMVVTKRVQYGPVAKYLFHSTL
jgi:hypothetical protein